MTVSTATTMLLIIQHLTTTAFATSAASSRAPSPNDIVSPLVALGNLVEPIQDPQQVKTWIIKKGETGDTKFVKQQKVFEGHYDKKPLPSSDVLKIDGQLISDSWKRLSIWKQQIGEFQGTNYLLSYNRDDKPGKVLWIISNRAKILWRRETRSVPPLNSGQEFPVLKYRVTLGYHTFCELHGMYKALLEANDINTCTRSDCQATNQKLVIENNALRLETQDLKQQVHDIGSEMQTLKVRQESWQKLVDKNREEGKDTDYDATAQEEIIQKLRSKMQELESELSESTLLVQEHKKTIEGMVDQEEVVSSSWKWSCIISGISVLVTVLLMSCGFHHFYAIRKKKWEIQRLRKLLSVNQDYRKADVIIDAHRRVSMQILQEVEGEWEAGTVEHGPVGDVEIDRPFSNLMLNSVAVQDVLMDDVMEEMETEGAETIIAKPDDANRL